MRVKPATVVLAAALAWPALGTETAAGVSGKKESLVFVAETGLTGLESDNFALCHLLEHRRVMAVIPLSYSVKSYALADFSCDTSTYIALSGDQVAELRRQGIVSEDIPETPALHLRYRLYPWGLWTIVLGGLGMMLARLASSFHGRKQPRGGTEASFEHKLVEVMMLTAGADGHVDEHEINLMTRAVARITGREVLQSDIRHLMEGAILPETPADFRKLGTGLDAGQRLEVLRAAVAMAVAGGQIARGERTLLDQLAQGLTIPVAAIDKMLETAGLAGNPVTARSQA